MPDTRLFQSEKDLRYEILALRTQDNCQVEAQVVWNPKVTPKSGVIGIHPDSSKIFHFTLNPLARSGFLAMRMKSRFAGNNTNMIMEEIMLDIAAGVEFLRERGCEKVALLGHSGGGQLTAFYQSQAESPTVTSTPAGDLPDLTRAKLPPADAVIANNIHLGRHNAFTDRIDPSVTDEMDPFSVDPSIDMFDSANYQMINGGVVYSPEFLKRYRKAQEERCDRITAWVWEKLKEIKERNNPAIQDLPFIIYRTMAYPGFLDRVNFKSEMPPGTLWGNPYNLNYNFVRGKDDLGGTIKEGLLVTLKSWLSSLYYGTANADTRRHIARITVPFLYVAGSADGVESRAKSVYDAVTTADRKLEYVKGATHYFSNEGHLRTAMDIISDWLKERGF